MFKKYIYCQVITRYFWIICSSNNSGFGGYPTRFTVEVALGVPGLGSLASLLNMLGVAQNYLDVTVCHKFDNVSVSFDSLSDSTMTWQLDNTTSAVYYTKDDQGNIVP